MSASIIEECFPPDLPNLTHVVINSYCRDSLRERHGIEAHVVPNVMDFDAGFGQPDDFNRRISDELGFAPNDIVLFQMTRVVRRKGIETAIELVERLDDPRVKLVVTGHATDDYNGEYLGELHRRAARLPRPEQVRFAADRFANVRVAENGAPGKFSLSDGYAFAHACTYFSRYEGFGNAFVEALAARVPIFVNNYEPVYWPDIGSKGFKTVQIENNELHRPGRRGRPGRADRRRSPGRHRRVQPRDRTSTLLVRGARPPARSASWPPDRTPPVDPPEHRDLSPLRPRTPFPSVDRRMAETFHCSGSIG